MNSTEVDLVASTENITGKKAEGNTPQGTLPLHLRIATLILILSVKITLVVRVCVVKQ